MMRTVTVSLFAALTAFGLTSGVQAQDGRGKNRGDEIRVQQSVGFSATERQIIVEFKFFLDPGAIGFNRFR